MGFLYKYAVLLTLFMIVISIAEIRGIIEEVSISDMLKAIFIPAIIVGLDELFLEKKEGEK